jgi:hypothetical protein
MSKDVLEIYVELTCLTGGVCKSVPKRHKEVGEG